MEAEVNFNALTQLYDLIVEIDGNRATISTSKNYGHWQYHLTRGSLSKSVAKHGITSFCYVGFSPEAPPPKESPAPVDAAWAILFNPVPSTATAPQTEQKRRGRPRKYLPKVEGLTVHKISDDEPPFRVLSFKDKQELERSFKVLQKTGRSLHDSLSYVCKQFYLPYKQAHELLGAHI